MKVDDAIKLAYENEVLDMDLSQERYKEILSYIDNQVSTKQTGFIFKLLKKLRSMVEIMHIRDLAEVAIVIIICISIPMAVQMNSKYLNKIPNDTTAESRKSAENKAVKNRYLKKIENLIADRAQFISIHPRDLPSVRKDEVYTNLDEINKRTPFAIDFPKHIPEGYSLEKIELSKTTYTGQIISTNNSGIIKMEYKNKEGKTIAIIEQNYNALWPGQQSDIDYETTTLNGLEAWVINPKAEGGSRQIVLWSGEKWYNVMFDDKVDRETLTKVAASLVSDIKRSSIMKEQSVSYTDMKKIRELFPFPLELPKYLPKDYIQESTLLTVTKDELGTLYTLIVKYSQDNEKHIAITVINEEGMPEELLKKFKKIDLNNSDAWIHPSNSSGKAQQIMFWRNGLYYNITSDKLSEEELVKLAESCK